MDKSGSNLPLEGVHSDHQHLHRMIRDLREMLAARQASPDAVRTQVRRFVDAVKKHFEHEESGGYFADAVAVAPRLSGRAEELLAEHRELSDRLDGLVDLASHPLGSPESWDQLTAAFGEIARKIDEHELAETTLLQQAYIDDIGAED